MCGNILAQNHLVMVRTRPHFCLKYSIVMPQPHLEMLQCLAKKQAFFLFVDLKQGSGICQPSHYHPPFPPPPNDSQLIHMLSTALL